MKVTYFERRPAFGCYSIERLFSEIRRALPPAIEATVVQCPTPEHTRWWLPRGLFIALRKAGVVNHIAGDIHYVALGLPRRRTIVTVHDLNLLDRLHGVRRILFCWIYLSLPLRRARFITAISEHTRERLEALFPGLSGKICVIPDCIPGDYVPAPKRLNKRLPRILQVGTRPNKNLERVIEALEGQPCILHIVGQLASEQKRLLSQHNITFENDVGLSDAEILKAYQAADILTFVSLNEGFGMPILEAQAIGRAVLTSDLSPMKEVAGSAACKVDPNDVREIRRGLRRLIEDDAYRELLIGEGFENVTRYSATAVAGQYAALYRSIYLDEGKSVN